MWRLRHAATIGLPELAPIALASAKHFAASATEQPLSLLKALVKLPPRGLGGLLYSTRIAFPVANLIVETVEKPSTFLSRFRAAIFADNHQANVNEDLNERLRGFNFIAPDGARAPLQDRPEDSLKSRHHACEACAPLGCMTIEFPVPPLGHRRYRFVGTPLQPPQAAEDGRRVRLG